MLIEVKGVGFVNKGAQLMLVAVLQQLAIRKPDAEVALEANSGGTYLQRAAIGAYQKITFRRRFLDLDFLAWFIPKTIRKLLKIRLGIVTHADVDVVLDASGFAYGDQWGKLNTWYLSNELQRLKRHGKVYIFLPQAFGPFTRPFDRKLLIKTLPLADRVFARENASLQHVAELVGKADNLRLYPDFTNLVKGCLPEYYRNGEGRVVIIPNSKMLSSGSANPEWQGRYINMLVNAVAVIRAKGLEPVLLNHEGKGDAEICRQVTALAGGQIEYIQENDPVMVKGIIGNSAAILCSRFHGCVSALSQGVPCIGTSWSHKYEELFEEYHRARFVIPAGVTAEELAICLDDAIASRNDPAYLQAVADYKAKSLALWDDVFACIDSSPVVDA